MRGVKFVTFCRFVCLTHFVQTRNKPYLTKHNKFHCMSLEKSIEIWMI